MRILSPLLFGVVASLDALLVGITYGIRNIRIRFRENILVSLITLMGTCLSILIGTKLGPLLPYSLGQIIGSIILILLGLYYIAKHIAAVFPKDSFRKNTGVSTDNIIASENTILPEIISTSKASVHSLSLMESTVLGITLSLNNMGIGLTASIAGLCLWSAAVVTFVCSVSFLLIGNYLGCEHSFLLNEKAADPASGLLLILLGICQFLF